jgi:hypothetical protein
MNMALAVDMPDAPVTQDTVTAGSDGDDEDQGDDDQEDAPVTQDTINEGGEPDDDANENDNDDDESDNNDNDNDPISKDSPTTSKSPKTEIECPKGQEVRLFSASCQPSQPDTECDGQGQPGAQLEGQEPESREVETEFSVSNEGNYASQCVPALQFGNTGNLNNQESSGSLPTVRSELQRFHT